jgi:hypothetical protein
MIKNDDDEFQLATGDFTIVDNPGERTPADSPELAVERLVENHRAVLETVGRLALLSRTLRGPDRIFFLQQFSRLLGDEERSSSECREAIDTLLEIETVFRPR